MELPYVLPTPRRFGIYCETHQGPACLTCVHVLSGRRTRMMAFAWILV